MYNLFFFLIMNFLINIFYSLRHILSCYLLLIMSLSISFYVNKKSTYTCSRGVQWSMTAVTVDKDQSVPSTSFISHIPTNITYPPLLPSTHWNSKIFMIHPNKMPRPSQPKWFQVSNYVRAVISWNNTSCRIILII